MNPSTPDVRNSCACNGPGCPDCNFESAPQGAAVSIYTERERSKKEVMLSDRLSLASPTSAVDSSREASTETKKPAVSLEVPTCAVAHKEGSRPLFESFDIASTEPATPAGDPDISTPVGMPGNSVSRGHGVQGDPATAASCTTLALETAAGIQLEELAEVCGEGETGWNAQRRNDIARKMQRIAANCPNRYSEDELLGTVVRAERGELR